MATGTQMQSSWAPWIGDIAETLKKCLAEVKHHNLKFQKPERLAQGRLLYTMIHWKNRRVATPTLPPSTSMQGASAPQACQASHAQPCHGFTPQKSLTTTHQSARPLHPCPPGCHPPLSSPTQHTSSLAGPLGCCPPEEPDCSPHASTACHRRAPTPPDMGSKPA
jgi:hypothetical protein